MNKISINGEQPRLEGKKPLELICHEMYYHGKLEELANVSHLHVDGKWYRLYFDYSIVFWRTQESDQSHENSPQSYKIEELDCSFIAVDVAEKLKLKNEVIKSITPTIVNNGLEVKFDFGNDKSLIFSNIDDISSYRVENLEQNN